MLTEICREILVNEGIHIDDNLSLIELIRQLEIVLPEAASIIKKYKNKDDAFGMLRNDHEMRHKIGDIWRMQLELSKAELRKSRIELAEFLLKGGFDHLVKTYMLEI